MLEAELWISFTSLLRSYTAAASLNPSAEFTIDSTEESISIASGGVVLAMHVDLQTGRGKWRLKSSGSATQGEFALLHDGRIDLDNTILDLDLAAIDFVAALRQPASTSAREDL